MNTAITTTGLRKSYGERVIFEGLDLAIEKGLITAIVGPNGAGKSTLFNLVAGVIKQEAGQVSIENFNRYQFSYMLQNYRDSILPWMNNLENIAFPLQIQGMSKDQREQKAKQLLEKHGLEVLAKGYPYELSGGQQQMLVFMRALVTEPTYLLLDEPFSALDYENALRMRNILQAYYREYKSTVFIITHDIEEAVYLASKILVLTSSPTDVRAKVDNNLAYPRSLETLKEDSFNTVKASVLDEFKRAISV